MQILRSFAPLALVAALVAGCAGCSDDGNTDTTVNTNLKYKQGATYTYHMYQRDSSNARISGSKNVVVWTVLQTDASYQGKNGVAKIEEALYKALEVVCPYCGTSYVAREEGDGRY